MIPHESAQLQQILLNSRGLARETVKERESNARGSRGLRAHIRRKSSGKRDSLLSIKEPHTLISDMSTGADATRAGAVFHCLILTRHRAGARALPIEHGLLRAMHNSCGYGLPPQNMQTTGHATCATISSCAAATTAEAQAEPQPTRCPADIGNLN